jgi:alkaline phosphatase
MNKFQKPVITALEAAKKKGLKTGIVVTSRITHGSFFV